MAEYSKYERIIRRTKRFDKDTLVKKLETGQSKEEATGACATVCTYIASYFCTLEKSCAPSDEDICSLIIRSCIRWKELVGEFTSVQKAFMMSLHTRMKVRFEQMHRSGYGGRLSVDLRHSLECGMKLFTKPVALFICANEYTFVFLMRERCTQIFFFDPHGHNAIFERVRDISHLIRAIQLNCRIDECTDFDLVWAQRHGFMDNLK